jgi:pimeloyl-ACP methyl ester carboxylesterase
VGRGLWHFQAFLRDGLRIPDQRAGRTVVCVHGYSQNATNFHGLRRALEAAGRPTVAVSLGYRLAPIGWYVAALERALQRLAGEHPEGLDLVAHSMGGVLVRLVLQRRPDLREALHTVVTLGSPHRGTAAARGIPWVPEIRALKRRSEVLASLPQLPELLPHARVVTIAGDHDTIVYPLDTALVPGTEQIVLRGIGHAGLLTDRIAWDAVVAALSSAEPA